MIATRSLCRIVALLGLLSCCWSAGANVITTGAPIIAETVAAPSNVVSEPTLAPAAPALAHTTAAADIPTGNHVVAAVSTHAPAIIPTHLPAPAKDLTTLVPHVAVSSVHPIVTVHQTTAMPAAAAKVHATVNAASKEVCTGFCEYLKPICDSLSKISDKQLFKIQTQFKSFVQKTNGKMSLCFVDHYSLDPTFKAVSHENLTTICASRNKLDNSKGSFQAFQACASNHWDLELDKELALIRESRANAVTHQHPESKTVAANIEHDEEELSMISEVVNKVLGQGGKLNEKNSDVKVIDVSGTKSTVAPVVPIVNGSSAAHGSPVSHQVSTVAPPHKSLLNDPNNTVMVFVDEKTTLAPKSPTSHVNTTVHVVSSTTLKPHINSTVSLNETKVETHAANATTPLPVVSTKAPTINGTTTNEPVVIKVNGTTTLAPATTLKPTDKTVTTTAPAITTKLPAITTKAAATTTHAPTNATTGAPSSTAAPTKPAVTTTKAPETSTSTAKPTLKPIETLEQILKRQEKEKAELDGKLKAERTKAISQLKKQDNSHAADAKIHQIEHERQMFIDPIGHTIKHQQYEAIKQKKSGARK